VTLRVGEWERIASLATDGTVLAFVKERVSGRDCRKEERDDGSEAHVV